MNATETSARADPRTRGKELIEARLTGHCAACGRRMPSWALEGESRHVGGHSLDVVYWYCRAGHGHRQDEPREVKR